jgi:methionyl-tRNA formyltransferase
MVSGQSLRVVFFGTPAFAVPTLDALITSRHQVVGVVTQPDRPRGRGQMTTDAPVKARARDTGITVLQPATLKDPAFLPALAHLTADIGVVAAYGKILTDAVLGVPPLGMINVHASLLPKYRGAAPVHRAVIAGETETGITIMRIVKALDAGPMLASARRPIGENETSLEVEHDLAQTGAALLATILDRLAAGGVIETQQDERLATYAARLTKEDGLVDWSEPAARIHNRIRGLHPWPHAYSFLGATRLILLRSAASEEKPGAPPGTILTAHGDGLRVAAGTGIVHLLLIQSEGKRPMTPREFLAGHPLSAGDRFSAKA